MLTQIKQFLQSHGFLCFCVTGVFFTSCMFSYGQENGYFRLTDPIIQIGGSDEQEISKLALINQYYVVATGIYNQEIEVAPESEVSDDLIESNIINADDCGAYMQFNDIISGGEPESACNVDLSLISGLSSNEFARIYEVVSDENSNIYISGFYRQNVSNENGVIFSGEPSGGRNRTFLLKFNPFSEEYEWTLTSSNQSSQPFQTFGLELVHHENKLFFFGSFIGNGTIFDEEVSSQGERDLFFGSINSQGVVEWMKTIGGSGQDRFRELKIDQDNNLWIAGTFEAQVDFNPDPASSEIISSSGGTDGFIAKYSSIDGEFLGVGRVNGTGNDEINAMVSDETGITFTGTFNTSNSSISLGSDQVQEISQFNHQVMFTAKVSFDFAMQPWFVTLDGTGTSVGTTIDLNDDSVLLVGGKFSGDINIGGVDFASDNNDGIITAINNENGELIWYDVIDIVSTTNVPNPIRELRYYDSESFFVLGNFIGNIGSYQNEASSGPSNGFDSFLAWYRPGIRCPEPVMDALIFPLPAQSNQILTLSTEQLENSIDDSFSFIPDNGCLEAGFLNTSGAFVEELELTCEDLTLEQVYVVAVDDSGNQSNTCAIPAEIVDVTAPVFDDCPDEILQFQPENTESFTLSLQDIEGELGDNFVFTATDNCTSEDFLAISLVNNVFNCDSIGQRAVYVVASDSSDNSDTCTIAINIIDETTPTLMCPEVDSLVFYLLDNMEGDGAEPLWLTIDSIETALGELGETLMASDNCHFKVGFLNENEDYVDSLQFDCSNYGLTDVSVIAQDSSMNTSSVCQFQVNISDSSITEGCCQARADIGEFSTDPICYGDTINIPVSISGLNETSNGSLVFQTGNNQADTIVVTGDLEIPIAAVEGNIHEGALTFRLLSLISGCTSSLIEEISISLAFPEDCCNPGEIMYTGIDTTEALYCEGDTVTFVINVDDFRIPSDDEDDFHYALNFRNFGSGEEFWLEGDIDANDPTLEFTVVNDTVVGVPNDGGELNSGIFEIRGAIIKNDNPDAFCGRTDNIIYLFVNNCSLSSDERISNKSVHVFPNPTRENVNIRFRGFSAEMLELTIINSLGQIVHRQRIRPESDQQLTLSTGKFQRGIHFIKIQSNSLILTKPLIIQ